MSVVEVEGASYAQPIERFAQANGLSRAYVYKLIKEGKLKRVKLGRRSLIRNEDAEAFFRSLDVKEAA